VHGPLSGCITMVAHLDSNTSWVQHSGYRLYIMYMHPPKPRHCPPLRCISNMPPCLLLLLLCPLLL
jgi:hypothetical protein